MIAVTFALPQESRDFLSALQHAGPDGLRGCVVGNIGAAEIVLTHTGVGAAAAAANVRALLGAHPPAWLVCAGFAGGLDRRMRASDLLVATNFSAPELIEKCRALPGPPPFFGPLTTQSEALETPAAKSRLAIKTGALAVDMETSAVAAECARAGVPLLAVRVISDAANAPLPVPMAHWFNLERQRPRPAALLAYLARHPAQVLPFATFVASLAPTRRALAAFLLALLRAESRSAPSP